jgi:hypothetical protein
MPKGRILGVDLNGNIRFRRSKKNPLIITSGTFHLFTTAEVKIKPKPKMNKKAKFAVKFNLADQMK